MMTMITWIISSSSIFILPLFNILFLFLPLSSSLFRSWHGQTKQLCDTMLGKYLDTKFRYNIISRHYFISLLIQLMYSILSNCLTPSLSTFTHTHTHAHAVVHTASSITLHYTTLHQYYVTILLTLTLPWPPPHSSFNSTTLHPSHTLSHTHTTPNPTPLHFSLPSCSPLHSTSHHTRPVLWWAYSGIRTS